MWFIVEKWLSDGFLRNKGLYFVRLWLHLYISVCLYKNINIFLYG